MNDKELQKIIDTKNGTISVLKDTVKKWVREYNMLDACIELQNEKIDAFQMSENEANEIIAELKAKNERLKAEMTELEEKFLTLNGKSYSYYTTLQEIKTIAEENHFYFVEGAIISYETIKQIATNVEKILDLITKVEEE